MSAASRIAMLMRSPTIPCSSRFCILPFQKRIKVREENATTPMTTGRHQAWLKSIPIPPTMRPVAASINKILARFLADSFPRSLENAHDPSGQTIPGLSSKNLALCPKYNKWTRLCSTMNMPRMNFIGNFSFFENGLVRILSMAPNPFHQRTVCLDKLDNHPGQAWTLFESKILDDYLAFQLATVIPIIAKSMRPDNPNNEKEILRLISLGNPPPSPRTRKLAPRVITSQRPICSITLDECFRLGVVRTSLMGLKPNNRNICLLNIPNKIMTIPRNNQKGNIVFFL